MGDRGGSASHAARHVTCNTHNSWARSSNGSSSPLRTREAHVHGSRRCFETPGDRRSFSSARCCLRVCSSVSTPFFVAVNSRCSSRHVASKCSELLSPLHERFCQKVGTTAESDKCDKSFPRCCAVRKQRGDSGGIILGQGSRIRRYLLAYRCRKTKQRVVVLMGCIHLRANLMGKTKHYPTF